MLALGCDHGGFELKQEIIGYLHSGDTVEIVEKCGDWYKVNFNGKTGYAHGKYLNVTDSAKDSSMFSEDALKLFLDLMQSGMSYEDETKSSAALTPEGNMTLVDDIGEEEDKSSQQFITLVTKAGNTFYLIIDRDKDGNQNVHFLNMVDEADLLAAAEAAGVEQAVCSCSEKCEAGAVNTECAVCSVNKNKCAGTQPEPVETEENAPEDTEPETGGNPGMLLAVLAVAVVGGGAAFYFKVIRPKQQEAAGPEEDYGGEPEDYEDMEDDGPPWDEDDPDENSEEDEE